MGDRNRKGLSVNTTTLIVILAFVSFSFALKMLNKYSIMKETGYVREKPLYEQLAQRWRCGVPILTEKKK